MYKVILSLVFLFGISSCKTFEGQIKINSGKILPIKVEEDSFGDEFNVDLKPGSYSTNLSFSTNRDLSLDISIDNEEYTVEAYLNKAFPDVEKEGDHKFFLTAKELEQMWSIKGNVNTKITRSALIKDSEFCSVRVRTWRCYHRESKENSRCRWVYHREHGRKDIDYYNKITQHKVFANIIYDSKGSSKIATPELDGILGSYTAQRTKNIRIYQYESCCYDYSRSCLDRRRH